MNRTIIDIYSHRTMPKWWSWEYLSPQAHAELVATSMWTRPMREPRPLDLGFVRIATTDVNDAKPQRLPFDEADPWPRMKMNFLGIPV